MPRWSRAHQANPKPASVNPTIDQPSASLAGHSRAIGGQAENTRANPTIATNYADVNARERLYGRTALMIAALEGHLDVARLLIEAGADLNIADGENSTALSLARSYGNLDVAALLSEAGAL